MNATTARERTTNLLAILLLAALVAWAAMGWGDFRAGWRDSSVARARLGDQP